MSYRNDQLTTILAIQTDIEHHSYVYMTTGCLHAYSNMTRLISELIAIKHAILLYEQMHGWDG